MSFSNILCLQFLKTSKIFFTQVLPEFTIFTWDQIIVSEFASSVGFGNLYVLFFVEFLHLLNFVL